MTTSTVDLPAVGTYALDPAASTITVRTRAMFGLLPVTATFAFNDGDFVVGGASAAHGSVGVRAASFHTGNAKRDHHVASPDFLDAEHHPEITYTATDVVASDGGWVVHGQLSVRGNTTPLELAVGSVETAGDAVTITATADLDRTAVGVVKGKGMVARGQRITVTARATRV